jgi:N-hydroxyarylamine O-acetyltransferase
MVIKAFEPDNYLRRINHSESIRLTNDGLEALHRAQLCTIPFENFDILLGRGISLEPAVLFNKLVHKSRGGYCFELNGLFLAALQFFGFDARALLARVHRSGSPSGRGHQISLVTIQGRDWIVDVGFGSPHLPAPIPLQIDCSATLDGWTFRLADAGPFGIMLQILNNGVWQNLYSFDLGHVCDGDIAYGNHFTSTHPTSFFTFPRMAALALPGGRISLFNQTLRKIKGETELVTELAEGQTYLDALKNNFGIELDAPYESLPLLQEEKTLEKSIIEF